MSKGEFLTGLREALSDCPESLQRENIQYYANYIDEQLQKGRSEEEIMEELGDPRWIAKSIMEAAIGDTRADETTSEYQSTKDKWYQKAEEHFERFDNTPFTEEKRHFALQSWMVVLIVLAVIFVVFMIIGTVFSVVLRVMLWILKSPVFWVLLLIYAGYNIWKDRH